MRVILAAGLVAAILVVRPSYAAVPDDKTCSIDEVVAVIRLVAGDPTKTHIKRAHPDAGKDAKDAKDAKNEQKGVGDPADEHAKSDTCIDYGDRLEAGPEAVVTIETTKGKRHIGGSYDAVFQAPEASEAVSPGAMSYVASLYHNLFSRSSPTVYATGRGLEDCQQAEEEALPLVPLDRLGQSHQEIGADLKEIVAAWKPSAPPHSVQATLRGKDGAAIARADSCGSAHVTLPLRPGDLHPNDALTLEIVDGRGERLDYDLIVVEPKDLPVPPGPLPSEWLTAAWRLAAGPPETRLDSIARLQTAPPDALAARSISEAIWLDSKF
ncbi:MAG: hypothetical protein WB715_01700 [Roseiarcus sp.]|uniref:hypothetical protein n=1 Tax=Roseiarcus sp. TaxID=1969460 RepID=UPI003C57D06F